MKQREVNLGDNPPSTPAARSSYLSSKPGMHLFGEKFGNSGSGRKSPSSGSRFKNVDEVDEDDDDDIKHKDTDQNNSGTPFSSVYMTMSVNASLLEKDYTKFWQEQIFPM